VKDGDTLAVTIALLPIIFLVTDAGLLLSLHYLDWGFHKDRHPDGPPLAQ